MASQILEIFFTNRIDVKKYKQLSCVFFVTGGIQIITVLHFFCTFTFKGIDGYC